MPRAAAILSLLLALPAVAQPATRPAPPRPTYLAAAREVTASIQKAFFDDRRALYARTLDDRAPEFMWGNGVMFSTLVAAARHDPATYRPVMDRFFAAMDRYWDAKAKTPGYEPAPTTGNDQPALARARRNADHLYARWKEAPPQEMIEQASIARTLWLLADHETPVGRAFWLKLDAAGPLGR